MPAQVQGRSNAEDIVRSFEQSKMVNCKHYPMVFIPGISSIRGEPQSQEENDKTYEESQKQRALERKLRKEKLDLSIMQAQGAPEDAIKAQRKKVRAASADIDEFCDATGRARRRSREYTPVNPSFPDPESMPGSPADVKKQMQQHYDRQATPLQEMTPAEEFRKLQESAEPKAPAPAQAAPEPAAPAAPPAPATRPTATFTPAKTIEEAEEYARKTFVDTYQFAATGISYKGISVDIANEINQTVGDFYQTYNVKKFSGIVAPTANSREGKMIKNAVAAYSPIRNSFYINRSSLKDEKTARKHFEEEAKVIQEYFAAPGKYTRISREVKTILENSRESGRATVPTTVKEALWHELGHSLEKYLKEVPNYEKIKDGYTTYAKKISGYATAEFSEYIAESFAAWNRGETVVDPELIEGFKALQRK